MQKSERASACHRSGCNCCQAVLCAFPEETGLSEQTLKKLGSAFGSGLGGMEGVCGALSGAEMVLGLCAYQGRPIRQEAKALHDAFKQKCGATICREIKGTGTGKILCQCSDCVKIGAELAEQALLAKRRG